MQLIYLILEDIIQPQRVAVEIYVIGGYVRDLILHRPFQRY